MSSSHSKESSTTSQDRRLSRLMDLMNPNFRDSVVSHVLNSRSDLPGDARESLDAMISREVRVERYPTRPERAPAFLLKPAIVRSLRESEALVSAVLGAWFSSQLDLRGLVEEHLLKRDIAVEYPDFKTRELNGIWSSEVWRSERDAILETNEDLDGDEVSLMLCCVTGRMPSYMEKSTEEGSRTVEQTILDQALNYLAGLPADSPEWEGVPTFMSSVAEISEVKAAEREAMASREALEIEIGEFLGRYADQVEYLQLDVSDWSVPGDCDDSVVSETLGLLDQLRGQIEAYDSIPSQAATHAEFTRLFEEREAIVHRIQGVKSKLDGILSPEDGPDRTPSPASTDEDDSEEPPEEHEPDVSDPVATAQPQSPEPSTDATLSGLRLSGHSLDFDQATLEYSVTLENSTDSVTITPVTNHSAATIDVIVVSQDDDSPQSVNPADGAYKLVNIPVGRTRTLVKVIAEDRETTRTYTLSIARRPSGDATLIALDSSVGSVEFKPDRTEYNIEFTDEVDDLSLTFQPGHDAATVDVILERPDGDSIDTFELGDGRCEISDLPEGRSTLSIVVNAEDGVTAKTYTLELTRETAQGTEHVELMWSLVAKDDLAGAYWLSKSLAANGQVSQTLPLLLKAVQGARWLSPDSDVFVEDLSTTVFETSLPFDDDALSILGLAAALQPSITAPGTNLLAWLASPACLPSVDGIVSPVRNYANLVGYPLRPEHIRGDEGQRRLDELIGKASSNAGSWLADSEMRHHNLVRATNVLRHLCADGGMLSDLLRPVVDDRRGEVARVKSDVEALKQDSYRSEVIEESDRIVLGSSPRNEITGAARAWLNRAIGEACDLAARWCALVERESDSRDQAQNRWMSDQVSELRIQIESASEMVLEGVAKVASDSNRSDVSASAQCLSRSIHQMLDYLSIEQDMDRESETPTIVRDLLTVVQGNVPVVSDGGPVDQLEVALSRRLLWIPAVDLDDDGRPQNRQTPVNLSEADEDYFAGDMLIDEAVRSRVGAGDFRFMDILKAAWEADQSDDMASLYSTDLAVSRETLGEHLSFVRDEVDQAANDGVIEYEGTRWSEFANTLDDIIVDDVLNFKEVHDDLDAIRMSVGGERTRRREELMSDWEGLTRESTRDTNLEAEFLKELATKFDLASRDESLDIRVMEDCVSRMGDYRPGDPEEFVLDRADGPRTTLEDFLTFCGGVGNRQTRLGGDGLMNLVRRSRDQE